MCAAPDPPPGSGARRHSRGRSAGVGWWQPPARSARPVLAAEPPGRVRRRAPQPGRAPADALTTPVGPALRGEVLAALDRGAPPRGSRTPPAAGTSRSGSGSSRRPEPGRATAPRGRLLAALPPAPGPPTRAAAPGRRARGRRARPRRRLPARVRVLRRPDPRRRRQQPGRADLLRRRQPAHPARARAGQPDGRPGRPGAPRTSATPCSRRRTGRSTPTPVST